MPVKINIKLKTVNHSFCMNFQETICYVDRFNIFMLSDIIVEFISSWCQNFTDADFCTFQFLSVFNEFLSFFVGNKSCNNASWISFCRFKLLF